MKIVKLGLSDIWVLRQLFKQAVATDFNYFPDHYQSLVLAQNTVPRLALASTRPTRLLLGAKVASRLVGYLIGSLPPDGRAQIYWLYVDPGSRGLGLGDSLLEEASQLMSTRGASSASLITAHYQDYYAKRGFELEKTVPGEGGIKMAIMTKRLSGDV